jgi:hypothetical protein
MTTADQLRAAVAADLRATVRDARSDVDADRLTTALLDWDEHHRYLVGLHDGATKAVYYDRIVSLVHSFPVPDGHVDALSNVESERAHDRDAVAAYVNERGPTHWNWLHPRYRWVFDDEMAVADVDLED